jgi:phosphoribosyl-ATP pyrophosphohydrolase
MESRLRANDHKEGWPTLSMGQVFKRMREEMEEMATAALMQEGGVLLEAADLANFAMFGALLAGELKT